jgi:cobalt-precorrin-5B (C1)-methyltransferase
LLLGYQGKLIKLAGGIFNTSSHLADAKLEIISAAVLQTCGDLKAAQIVLGSKTADAAYKSLVELGLAPVVFGNLTQKISVRAASYVQKYANASLKVGTMLTDRQGEVVGRDAIAATLLSLHQES